MASAMATKRLRKEYMAIQKKPVENIQAAPLESNILEWHYVIKGTKDSPYAGGFYHGKLKFPPQYPMKPPSVLMLTPNGRFHPNRRLCLSMSDFHPETWNPMWSVSSILTGLYSFMLDNAPTMGSMEASKAKRRRFAEESLEYNVRDPIFCELFPELVELHQQRLQLKGEEEAERGGEGGQGGGVATAPVPVVAERGGSSGAAGVAGAGGGAKSSNDDGALGVILAAVVIVVIGLLLAFYPGGGGDEATTTK